jgi:hypothetical protein
MNIAQIEQNIQDLIKDYTQESFIYDFLLAYGLPKASITRLQKGNLNLSKVAGEVSWKKKVFFKPVDNEDLHITITNIRQQLTQDQRFVIVTDFKSILAIDTKIGDTLDIDLLDLPQHFDFFLPWAGMERATHQNENPADVKAAEKMAKLFDEIKKDNPDNSPEFIHGLNVFLSRLLFCFFAEDTNIFESGIFTNAIHSHTQVDGSDLNDYLDKLFQVLNTPDRNRKDLPAYLQEFPYVNGGLFEHKHIIPSFTRRSRQAIIDAGELVWSAINPDIFGSMFQAVIAPDHRGSLGAHYTSVPNIMKVIEPLFLNDLNEEFENGKYEPKKLNKLLERLGRLKIFDPASGSGNFLIIAYKELRLLEIKILKQLQELQKATTGFEGYQAILDLIPKAQLALAAQYQPTLFSRIELGQFFGIEIDDFAHEIAILSLWLAQHQMNQKFKEVFGETNPTLPLQAGGNIVHGNATRLDWEVVCPKKEGDETYILGNPPYLGRSLRNLDQQRDMDFVFLKKKNYKDLDYIACWFYKGTKFIKNTNSEFAFVSTNSICQGTQVNLLWSDILSNEVSISFCYTPYKWMNNARSNAGVTVVSVGLRADSKKGIKKIYNGTNVKIVDNISPYLTESENLFIENRFKPISHFPEISLGNAAKDNGALILSVDEYRSLLGKYPILNSILKKFIGAEELINGSVRYCLWINDEDLINISSIPEIVERLEICKKMRSGSKKLPTQKLSDTPHRFGEIRHKNTNSIIIPSVSSEKRNYIPTSFLDGSYVISNSAFAVYNAEFWIFSIISSLTHMVWVKSVAGRLESRIRYSSQLCYNTFPFPKISESQKQELTECVFKILEERENHSEKTLAQLYDPEKMPAGLREAHRLNDLAVERCYRSKPFESDEERLEYLFKLYEKMIAAEKEQELNFAEEKKAKKTRKIK